MTVKKLMQVMLELDDLVVHPRPSTWLRAAQLIGDLATHAEGSLRNHDVFGDGWAQMNVADGRGRNDRTGW